MSEFKGESLGWFLVIKDIEPKIKKTSGGLELSKEHRKDIRYNKAEVVSVGHEINKLHKGDVILYDKHAGNQLEEGDNLFKVIRATDAVVIWEKKDG